VEISFSFACKGGCISVFVTSMYGYSASSVCSCACWNSLPPLWRDCVCEYEKATLLHINLKRSCQSMKQRKRVSSKERGSVPWKARLFRNRLSTLRLCKYQYILIIIGIAMESFSFVLESLEDFHLRRHFRHFRHFPFVF